MSTYIWLGVLILSLVVEAASMEIVSIWFSVGSLVALILSLCGASITAQCIVFASVAFVCIVLLRNAAKKWLLRHDNTKTNLDAEQGKMVIVLKDISPNKMGEVKLNGVVWNAITETNQTFTKGHNVEIVRFEGTKIIIK